MDLQRSGGYGTLQAILDNLLLLAKPRSPGSRVVTHPWKIAYSWASSVFPMQRPGLLSVCLLQKVSWTSYDIVLFSIQIRLVLYYLVLVDSVHTTANGIRGRHTGYILFAEGLCAVLHIKYERNCIKEYQRPVQQDTVFTTTVSWLMLLSIGYLGIHVFFIAAVFCKEWLPLICGHVCLTNK